MDKIREYGWEEECYLNALSSENNRKNIIAVSYNQDSYEFGYLKIDNLDKLPLNIFSMINSQP